MMKRTVVFLIAAVLVFVLAGGVCAVAIGPDDPLAAPAEEAENPTQLTFPKSIVKGTEEDADPDDNTFGPVNEAYALYYKEGSAAEGVKSIISAGKCFVNGIAVPSTEEEYNEQCPDGFSINGSTWLSKNDSGWAVSSGFFPTTLDVPYEDAAVEMIKSCISNGLETVLYDDDEDGFADRMETMVYIGVGATTVTHNDDGTYTIDIGSYDSSIDYPAKYDTLMNKMVEAGYNTSPLENILPECFDETIEDGDAAVYYMDADGNWNFVRAKEVNGVFNDGADHQYYVMDDVKYLDAMNGPTVSYSAANRSGGYSSFMKFFGFNNNDDYKVSMWLVPVSEYATANGKPLGFTSNENAETFLKIAVDRAKEQLDNTVISEDGRDVPEGRQWISEALYNELDVCVKMAEDTLAVEKRPVFLDYQTYLVYLTLNGTGGDITAKFTGYDFDGFENYVSEYYTLAVIDGETELKISDERFDQYFEGGSAASGLKAVVDAGEVYVNNYQLPTQPGSFEVNGKNAVYSTEDGQWAWNTHELYSGISNDYADAAYNFTDNLSGLAGQSVQLLAKTGCDVVSQIRTTVVEVGLAANLGGNFAVVYFGDGNGETFKDGNGNEITFDSENGSSSVTNHDSGVINEGDIVVFWKDAKTTGATSKWVATRAAYARGTLSGTLDDPLWTEEGATEAVPVDEAIVDMTNLPDENRLAAFIDLHDTVTMWTLPTDSEITTVIVSLGLSGKTIGFTYDAPKENTGTGPNEMMFGEFGPDGASFGEPSMGLFDQENGDPGNPFGGPEGNMGPGTNSSPDIVGSQPGTMTD